MNINKSRAINIYINEYHQKSFIYYDPTLAYPRSGKEKGITR